MWPTRVSRIYGVSKPEVQEHISWKQKPPSYRLQVFSLFHCCCHFQGSCFPFSGICPFAGLCLSQGLLLFFHPPLCHFSPASLGLSLGPCTCHKPKLKIQVVILKKITNKNSSHHKQTSLWLQCQWNWWHGKSLHASWSFHRPGLQGGQNKQVNKWQHKCDTGFALHDAKAKKKTGHALKKTVLGLPYALQLVQHRLAGHGLPIARQQLLATAGFAAAGSSASIACCTHSAGWPGSPGPPSFHPAPFSAFVLPVFCAAFYTCFVPWQPASAHGCQCLGTAASAAPLSSFLWRSHWLGFCAGCPSHHHPRSSCH